MAFIKRPTKGAPPVEAQASRNLTRSEDFELRPLNFKVSADFKRDFKAYANQQDISMVELLQRCFDAYKQETK